MNRALTALLAALVLAGGSVAAHAQSADKDALRAKISQMSPEEKAAAKEKMRQKWESMTPEQREAAKKRFAARHPDAAQRLGEKGAAGQPTPAAGASAPN